MLKRWVPFVVLSIGLWVLGLATDQYRGFTTEGARRIQILDNPRPLPDTVFVDMEGKPFRFADHQGKLLLVDFIYTSCPTICYAMGATLEQVQSQLERRGIDDQVLILSISFDPDRDDVPALHEYGQRFESDAKHWNVVTITDKNELDTVLDVFGITVLPAPGGEFEHNGAIHLVERSGKLIGIHDFSSPRLIVEAVEAVL